MVASILALVFVLSASPGVQKAGDAACSEWEQCRDLALEAAGRQDYEAFHDLAWRALQRGPRSNPELMAMLARAQSLSGRPHDALVMLQRLAALGAVTDAAGSDDFRRVRALSGWPEFENRIAELRASGAVKSLIPGPAMPRATAVPALPGVVVAPPVAGSAPATGAVEPSEPVAAGVGTPDAAPGAASTDTLRFSTAPFSPAGLVHDAASKRFIIADRDARRLAVVSEQSRRISSLAAAGSAGFGRLSALAIDPREGDLWVISASEEPPTARLHKLQLISGRVLYEVTLPEKMQPARFTDVALAPGSGVLVLDAEGRRVLRVSQRSRELVRAASLDRDGLVSIAPASTSVAFVAHATGIARLDLGSGAARDVKAPADVTLDDLSWIRYWRGSLIAMQRTGANRYRMVRFQLDDAGRAISGQTVVDPEVTMTGPPPAAISGDALYYLSETPAPDFSGAVEIIVRRIALKP